MTCGTEFNDMHKDTVNLTNYTCYWRIPYPEPVYTGWSSVHWNATGMPLIGPVYTGYHWEIQQIFIGYTRTLLEKIVETDPYWNATGQTLTIFAYTGNHWKNLVETVPHWDATEETLTFVAYTGTPLEGLQQPTHTQAHIV